MLFTIASLFSLKLGVVYIIYLFYFNHNMRKRLRRLKTGTLVRFEPNVRATISSHTRQVTGADKIQENSHKENTQWKSKGCGKLDQTTTTKGPKKTADGIRGVQQLSPSRPQLLSHHPRHNGVVSSPSNSSHPPLPPHSAYHAVSVIGR